MKNLTTLLLMALTFSGIKVAAAEIPNGVALPSEIYMLPGRDTDLHTQAFLRRWNPYGWFVRVEGECAFTRRLPSVTTVSNPADGMKLVFSLVDGNDFNTLSADTVSLCVPGCCNAGEVKVQVLGDSFVQGAFYRTALVDSLNVPGIKMVGLRGLEGSSVHSDEGRGGWTMKSYFTISKGECTPYNGFMQPADGKRYLGDCRFWVNCHKVSDGKIKDFETRYQCGRFAKCAERFSKETGMPLKPVKNDLMWDGGKYLVYNGKKWTAVDCDESQWSFNYPKYLEIWNLETPDFLFETLGLNDFRDALDADYAEWDSMAAAMKDSYLKANPDGKFAIVIPCSCCGSMENRRGDFTVRQNACMWEFRNHLVNTFDHRKGEGYHLVDMGITISNENGYRTDSEGLQTGNPHPYPNYPAMGEPLAAFIQYHRKK